MMRLIKPKTVGDCGVHGAAVPHHKLLGRIIYVLAFLLLSVALPTVAAAPITQKEKDRREGVSPQTEKDEQGTRTDGPRRTRKTRGRSRGREGANTSFRPPAIYRVRVTVIDPQRVPVEDAKVWSTVGGEPKKVAGGWQFDIPGASLPGDGKVTF